MTPNNTAPIPAQAPHKSTMLTHIAALIDMVYIARDPEIARSERRKMLRETTEGLYNLKYYIDEEVF